MRLSKWYFLPPDSPFLPIMSAIRLNFANFARFNVNLDYGKQLHNESRQAYRARL